MQIQVEGEDKWDIAEKKKEVMKKLEKWIEYGEYVRIKFDLINMKAEVL